MRGKEQADEREARLNETKEALGTAVNRNYCA